MEESSARSLRSLFAPWIQPAPVTRSPRHFCSLACMVGRCLKQRLLPTPPEQPLHAASEQERRYRTSREHFACCVSGAREELGKKYDYRSCPAYKRCAVSSRGLWLRMNYWEKAGRRQVSPTTEDHFSVQEVAHAGEDHGQAEPVGGGDNIGIAHRAAWLDHRRGARFRGFFHSIRKGKEGVGSDHSAGQRRLRLHHCEFHGIDAAHLACANTERGAILCKHDGVGLHVLRHFPGKEHGVHLFGFGRAFGYRAQFVFFESAVFFFIDPASTENAFELQFAFRL